MGDDQEHDAQHRHGPFRRGSAVGTARPRHLSDHHWRRVRSNGAYRQHSSGLTMSAPPRNLLVLRVDDDLPNGIPQQPYPVNFANQLPPPFLDPALLGTRQGPTLGMNNWASAVGYW